MFRRYSFIGLLLLAACGDDPEKGSFEFDLTEVEPADAEIFETALPAILKECPALAKHQNHFTPEKVQVDWAGQGFYEPLAYEGSSKPWVRRYTFLFRASDEAKWDWAGHRFGVEFSTDPIEIGAWKTMGVEICDLPARSSVRHAPILKEALDN